jgi:hypothetical protein
MPALDRAVLAALILCLPRGAGAAPSSDTGHWATDPNTRCALFDATLRPGDTVNWIGECRDGRAEGLGTASFFNNGAEFESFTGTFAGGVAKDGHVTVRWGNGWSYEGDMVAGRFDGQGLLINDKKDRFEGNWKDGKLNGTGSVIHDNGERYDGEWKDDLPNGHGVLIRADGSRLEGEFANGKFNGGPAPAAMASAPPAMPVSTDKVSTDKVSADKQASEKIAIDQPPKPADPAEPVKPSTPASALSSLSGKKLLAVDGAALALTSIEGGIERDITAANGTLEKTTFTFINDRLGTVAADGGTGAANVTGFFRLTDSGVEVRYADGHGEILSAKDDGVLLRLETPGASPACRSFYPAGHAFTDTEKKAAVAAYASRLGLGVAADVKSACSGDVAQTPPSTPGQPGPDAKARAPEHHTDARRPAKATPASLRASPGLAAAVKDKMAALAPVTVKDSVVHAVDGMPPIPATPGEIAAIAPPAAGSAIVGQHDASHCLRVESDGLHWGFRNACAFDVQFAYCLQSGGDALTACDGPDNKSVSVAGSVPAKSFSALMADKSFSEKDADHDFRWLACDGGAGEVVAHLDRIDPPSGRCVRASDLASNQKDSK